MFIQHFARYVCPGDSITCDVDGFTITARLAHDIDTRPERRIFRAVQFDCYSPAQIEAWQRDKWFFAGLVLSVSKNGVTLSTHAASLWGIECNIGEDNAYLLTAANELLPDALAEGRSILDKLLAANT